MEDRNILEALPVELYWQICSYVPAHTKTSLALASRHVHVKTVPELYRAVKFNVADSTDLHDNFSRLRKYAGHVRRLTVRSANAFALSRETTAALVRVLGSLEHVFSFEWNACHAALPAVVLEAVFRLRELAYLQTCSVPSDLNVSANLRALKSVRVLRLRSLGEARAVNGIITASPLLSSVSIRVADTGELDDAEHAATFLHVLFADVRLRLSALALFNFAQLDLDFLARHVQFSDLRTLRLESSDPHVLSTLSDATVLPRAMRTLDLTFGKSVFRPDQFCGLVRGLESVQNLNLKLLCAPATQERVLAHYIAPFVLSLAAVPYQLRKLSLHIWSISAGHYILLAPWSLADLHALAASPSGKTIRSLALDLSRGATPFSDLVQHLKRFECLRELYVNYAPSFYYGSGVYDVCRKQAMTLRNELLGLELIWLNSVELRVPIRKRKGGRDFEDVDEHLGDEYFADDSNFHIFASRLF